MTVSREIKAACASGALVGAYMLLVLLSGRVDVGQFGRLFAFYLKTGFALWLLLGMVGLFIYLFRRRPVGGEGPGAFDVTAELVRSRWQGDRFVSAFWPPLLFAALLASFNAFKQMVLPVAGYSFDRRLAQLDRLIFLGHEPWRVTHSIFYSPTLTLVIDRAYHGWFVPMSLGILACAWLPPSRFQLRAQYCLTYVGIWIGIGSILAFALSSAGPCFFDDFVGPSPYDGLMARLAEAQQSTGFELEALKNQAMLLRAHASDTLSMGGGISAMPSVHIALSVLFALGAFKLNRTAGIILAVYAFLIWVGSIHLGWHYAADGLVSAMLVMPLWLLAGRVARSFDGGSGEQAPRRLPA